MKGGLHGDAYRKYRLSRDEREGVRSDEQKMKRKRHARPKDDTTNDYIRSRRAEVDAALDRIKRGPWNPAEFDRILEQVRAAASAAIDRAYVDGNADGYEEGREAAKEGRA